ncbi:CDP-diacylglycerol diphosphatase [Escherichia coli]
MIFGKNTASRLTRSRGFLAINSRTGRTQNHFHIHIFLYSS